MKYTPLLTFLAMSAGVHGGLFMSINSHPTVSPYAENQKFNIYINEQKQNNSSFAKKTPGKYKRDKTHESNTKQINPTDNKNAIDINNNELAIKPVIETGQSQITDNSSPEEKNTPSVKKEIDETNREQIKARVYSQLVTLIYQDFQYPQIARLKNWEGKVLVNLQITSDGELKNISILNSSGYRILDQDAVNSLSQIKYIPQSSKWLDNEIDMTIPVIYQLTKG